MAWSNLRPNGFCAHGVSRSLCDPSPEREGMASSEASDQMWAKSLRPHREATAAFWVHIHGTSASLNLKWTINFPFKWNKCNLNVHVTFSQFPLQWHQSGSIVDGDDAHFVLSHLIASAFFAVIGRTARNRWQPVLRFGLVSWFLSLLAIQKLLEYFFTKFPSGFHTYPILTVKRRDADGWIARWTLGHGRVQETERSCVGRSGQCMR